MLGDTNFCSPADDVYNYNYSRGGLYFAAHEEHGTPRHQRDSKSRRKSLPY